MNKLLFKLERNFNDNITLIANNHKDLEDHLNRTLPFGWYKLEVKEHSVMLQECEGCEMEFVSLEWVKHI